MICAVCRQELPISSGIGLGASSSLSAPEQTNGETLCGSADAIAGKNSGGRAARPTHFAGRLEAAEYAFGLVGATRDAVLKKLVDEHRRHVAVESVLQGDIIRLGKELASLTVEGEAVTPEQLEASEIDQLESIFSSARCECGHKRFMHHIHDACANVDDIGQVCPCMRFDHAQAKEVAR